MASLLLQCCFFLFAYLSMIQICLGNTNTVGNVKLDLYYESLCPFSAKFIMSKLPVIFENGLMDIVDLRLFPWGNAKLASNNSITCQHGPKECLLNTVEACAIYAWPNVDVHVPFITCVESQASAGKYKEWKACFQELGLDPEPVNTCYKGEGGKQLELIYANLTASLKPPHVYVPWVVVDGKPLEDDYENFISHICKAYKGIPPTACVKTSLASALKGGVHALPLSDKENKPQRPRSNENLVLRSVMDGLDYINPAVM
ncbi:gamma-interferon-inducible lysosomal thiol reductase-like [Chenopodium quinoa]|uniref:Gamma-interferon-inducible lysosomal thiol reductase n=1 Tax=Chenopodium quinoa TaxID=63459 RepID=A0A803LCV1_CHEQI|nr:gamma-interferon-inducible lysosomal thiol reductase-like [Chenopodium quinoa]